jgi:hypothetical protein
MATLIPSIGAARFDTRGELRLAERLKDFLEDNAWVWHNLPVGPFGRHPDFVVLHPRQGLVVLEVKDWRLDSISKANKMSVELLTSRGLVTTVNPFEQARAYMFNVLDTLKRDPMLLNGDGHLAVGAGIGVVFPNITRRQFDQTDLHQVFSADRCIFRDEMSEGADPEEFRERFWSLAPNASGRALSMPQIDRVRALLFPEIRVTQVALSFDEPQEDNGPGDDRMLSVMDMQQELVARSLGGGHRIVRGVAGSGKTLILAFRAEYIARVATRPVLVLCYGNGIAGRLENAMQDRGVEDRVIVSTFHSWCWRMLRSYDLPAPSKEEIPDYDERLRAGVRAVIEGVEKGLIPAGQYEAVLIDEAHDFEPEWLALAARMVSPETNSLMVVYDDAQAIYTGRKRPVWRQLGIQASGRTTVLKLNYRNTAPILRFARKFAADVIGKPGICADDEDAILLPEDAGREGPEPTVRKCVSEEAEAHAVAEWLSGRRAAGYRWSQMALLYPTRFVWEKFEGTLRRHGIPVDFVKKYGNRIRPEVDAVRVLSMHNSKGLEFPVVAIGGLSALRSGDIEDNVRLTYVAITRATHEVFLTWSRMTPLVERLVF